MMSDSNYMQRCIELAKKGAGHVAPNPMVGSVIVHNEKIIGEGFHKEYGKAHAEVEAINSVKNKELLKDSTIYINLEPCAHFGKTPPCADLIIKNQLKEVKIGCIDSFSKVAGKGIEKLENAGIKVTLGILKQQSLDLNRRFFTFHNKHRPYVILKWAQSRDGFIDKNRSEEDKGIHWITQKETKQIVHKWRHEEAAILVGKNTILNDNPHLTCRDYKGNNPVRIVIDPRNELDINNYNVSSSEAKTIVLNEPKLEVVDILNRLHKLNLQSVIIEGGAFTLNKFINSGTWDEARVLEGVSEIKKGLSAPIINKNSPEKFNLGKDKLYIYYND